jgi:hypothetical protein
MFTKDRESFCEVRCEVSLTLTSMWIAQVKVSL